MPYFTTPYILQRLTYPPTQENLMAIIVNGVEITEAMVQAEQENHADAHNPRDATVQELILR